MSDEHQSGPSHEHDATGWIVLGGILVVAGFFLGARNLGIVPWPLGEVWDIATKARYGLGIVLIGVLLIVWAQSDRRITLQRKGVRLYRSRDEKWIAGVFGGLAEYFGIDATILRLIFIALMIVGAEGIVIAYIVMAIVVPLAPTSAAAPAVAAPTAWPETGATAAPAPPAPPAWPETGAPAAPIPPAPPVAPGAPATPAEWGDSTPPPAAPPL